MTVPGSEVFVDGRSRGTANPGEPLDIPDAGLGLVAVKVVADGHETLEREYDLQPGTWTMIELAPQSNIERREDFGISQWEDIVEVDEFFIHQHEVTNTQFAAFLNARGNQREGGQPWIRLDDRSGIQKTNNGFEVKMLHDPHPVVQVTWYAAAAYCKWVGKRLPKDEEWRSACQGKEGYIYPWGDTFALGRANIKGHQEDRHPATSPVGHFPEGASPYGAMDMSGNVWEWTASRTVRNQRFIRGGSWYEEQGSARCTNRKPLPMRTQDITVGFRCAM